MITVALALTLLAAADGESYRMDMPLPPQPEVEADLTAPPTFRARELGQQTTLFVNFDGVDLSECNPSNAKNDCSWYNFEKEFPPFSGELQTRVSVLQAMRADAAPFGIRITGVRPPDDQDYTMVVYGGTEQEYEALGSAPSGDCDDQNPNQIAFAHVDGELNHWVNGGATTALHEAAHSWGLDHIDVDGTIMFPAGNNGPAGFRDECDIVVSNTELDPGVSSCGDINLDHCGNPNQQNSVAMLTRLYGEPYVDTTPPKLNLVEPSDGQYFQAPADFDIIIETEDDLHPQLYSVYGWFNDNPRPETAAKLINPGLIIEALPVGSWAFHVIVADEAGNESRVDFDIEVGVDPPPDGSEGCGCVARGVRPRVGTVALLVLLAFAGRRRRVQ